jgi:hypothetical protein
VGAFDNLGGLRVIRSGGWSDRGPVSNRSYQELLRDALGYKTLLSDMSTLELPLTEQERQFLVLAVWLYRLHLKSRFISCVHPHEEQLRKQFFADGGGHMFKEF